MNHLFDNDELYRRWFQIELKPHVYHQGAVKKQIKKDVRSVIESEYKDSLTFSGPVFQKALAWLKEPLELLDRISKLKRIDEI